ncbi:sigma-70 family RNA polymerase sigma factor [Pseudomonas sp. NPDC089569]|uniref:sigma-70 family RNA polymerase sigma factor n=1 Tax=Pseudomonas sp. NPDC089569 TaxID=3390722 RepID=UPI003D06CA19
MSGTDVSPRNDLGGLFRTHYPWLCAWLRQHLGTSAEDIAAEAFLQLLQAPGPIHEPRAWLTTIARRLIYRLWCRRDLERRYVDQSQQADRLSTSSPEELVQLTQALQDLDRTLARLPAKVRQAFLLSRVDGLTYPQIAAELGISLRSVSVYMTRSQALCARHSANQSLNFPRHDKRSA